MWQIFKSILESKIDLHIPKVKNFNTFKKENWSRPLNSQIRKKIARKHRLWTRYMETRDDKILKKYKAARNVVKREIQKQVRLDQREIADQCKL